jgi:SAM-dependent methyltransferase
LHHIRTYKDCDSFEKALIKSPEYQQKNNDERMRQQYLGLGRSLPVKIQTDASDAQLQKLFEQTQKQWSFLGRTDPYWSVITHPNFKKEKITDNLDAFFESGSQTAKSVETFWTRNGFRPINETCVELGCGVGRVTVHLAKVFKKVVAVDISPGNLDLCKVNAARFNASNVTTFLLTHPSQLSSLPRCEFFYSVIVLQHNPPPVASFCLDQLLGLVKPGGAALFQVPTHTPGYSFDLTSYLEASNNDQKMEMHCIPMQKVFSLLARHGFIVMETLADDWTPFAGSHTFFAVKSSLG